MPFPGRQQRNVRIRRSGLRRQLQVSRSPGALGISLGLWGECLARKKNFVEIEIDKADAYGIPILKMIADWSDNEKKIFEDARIHAAGGQGCEDHRYWALHP